MAGAVDLRFSRVVEDSPGPVNLVFGEPGAPAAEDITGTLAATLAVPVPDLALLALGALVLDLPDADGAHLRARSQQAAPAHSPLRLREQQMEPLPMPGAMAHTHAAPLETGCRVRHRATLRQSRHVRLAHQHGARIAANTRARHAEAMRARAPATMPQQHGIALDSAAVLAHAETLRLRRRLRSDEQQGAPVRVGTSTAHRRRALRIARRLRTDHAQQLPLPVGWWQAVYPWPEPPPPPWSGPVHLRFCKLADGSHALRFGPCIVIPTPPPAGIVVPILETYIVINSFSLVLASDSTPLECADFSASLDVDSWCWGWSARMHADLMPLVRPAAPGEHVELIATINGTPLRLVVERIGRDRRFGEAWLKVSGRGRAAWLADPHSPIQTRLNATQMTAQQLLVEALKINGVSIGWDLDWQITDWQVPAGAWSHTGTYIDAALRIAEAGGAYVQAHDTDQTLIILPRYPVAPWIWGDETPDIELPEDVIEVEGIEWIDRPDYNAVWISGSTAGRRDRIKRTGSAADRYAQSIVDPLATAPEMTRQRGLAVLGDTGRQAHITLRLPVLPETGILRPGQLIRYIEQGTPHVGLARAVQVDNSFPDIWQTVRLETHE